MNFLKVSSTQDKNKCQEIQNMFRSNCKENVNRVNIVKNYVYYGIKDNQYQDG